MEKSPKSWWTTFLLCHFLGWSGAHRFYVGKTKTGILLLLLNCFTLGIWWFIDWIKILLQKFTDNDGNVVKR